MQRLYCLMIVVLFGLVFARPPGIALTGAQARQLLSGNTVVGTWEGNYIHLYLNANGTLVYKVEDKPSVTGRWTLKENELCWRVGTANNCANAHKDDQQHWMKVGVSTYYPFEVRKGNQVPK